MACGRGRREQAEFLRLIALSKNFFILEENKYAE
jgi:hypothetical protein